LLSLAVLGCGEAETVAPGDSGAANARDESMDASAEFAPPATHNSAIPQPPFVPASSPEPIPAHNELSASDAATEPEAIKADSSAPNDSSIASNCLLLLSGERSTFEAILTRDKQWRRIEPSAACPAQTVTATNVAYAPYVLCAVESERTIEIIMRGADMLPMPLRDVVADPMLAIYRDEARAFDDPFDCLAVNDDGVFDGVPSNSARVEGLVVPAGMRATVLATSFEPPEQHGVGLYSLELHAL
jgi:hypothetical protein